MMAKYLRMRMVAKDGLRIEDQSSFWILTAPGGPAFGWDPPGSEWSTGEGAKLAYSNGTGDREHSYPVFICRGRGNAGWFDEESVQCHSVSNSGEIDTAQEGSFQILFHIEVEPGVLEYFESIAAVDTGDPKVVADGISPELDLWPHRFNNYNGLDYLEQEDYEEFLEHEDRMEEWAMLAHIRITPGPGGEEAAYWAWKAHKNRLDNLCGAFEVSLYENWGIGHDIPEGSESWVIDAIHRLRPVTIASKGKWKKTSGDPLTGPHGDASGVESDFLLNFVASAEGRAFLFSIGRGDPTVQSLDEYLELSTTYGVLKRNLKQVVYNLEGLGGEPWEAANDEGTMVRVLEYIECEGVVAAASYQSRQLITDWVGGVDFVLQDLPGYQDLPE